ncbi:hypothetical protein BDN72DRAFT_851541 [Pluteus cervinus]|uniref:Uncharacterized protein n=1 Tax=Pluteus cervinus TaxID=181527 RepID=A0ACD2ZZS1_9AGAR|nr:hypothetical protein BDN72DRAFT_851541 [Pluteus cervinus]
MGNNWRKSWCEALKEVVPQLKGTTSRPKTLRLQNGVHSVVVRRGEDENVEGDSGDEGEDDDDDAKEEDNDDEEDEDEGEGEEGNDEEVESMVLEWGWEREVQ